ncbi:MAG: hypothetical protein A4E72_01752 [Syntrophus sp. PtaU1.Bin208]|nr:MAG: hypothetical protein A4E72_01752 [Syntrophus sp. PtaU1.Bin208]
MTIRQRMQNFYQQFLSLKGDPTSIACGMAMGVFVGITPTIPFHTVAVLFFAFLFKINLTSAYLGSWLVCNPFTIPLLYLGEYQIGRYILGRGEAELVIREYSFSALLQLGWDVCAPLLLGGLVLAVLFTVPAYFLSYRFISSVRKNETHEICSADSP